MSFKIGDIVEIHSLVNHIEYNGREGTVMVAFRKGDVIHYRANLGIAPRDGYLLQLSDEFVCVAPSFIRYPRKPGNESVDQIWNDLIYRLTEGIPA